MQAKIWNKSKWVTDTNPQTLKPSFEKMLINSGFKIEGCIEKHFSPQGYTCLFLLSESHFAIHTFPEEGKTYIELSSCVVKPFQKFINYLNQLSPK